jgi:uncharacterized protein (DUF3820 family)
MDIKLGFGKHKGKTLKEVPNTYLDWMFSIFPESSQLSKDTMVEIQRRIKNKIVIKDLDYKSSHLVKYDRYDNTDDYEFEGSMEEYLSFGDTQDMSFGW